jgi:hypothetical protein
MHVGNYLGLVQASEEQLANAFLAVTEQHQDEPDIGGICHLLASWSREHVEKLNPLLEKYNRQKSDEPERLHQALFEGTRTGSLALLRDLHDLWLLANEVHLCWTVLDQAAKGLRDAQLEQVCLASDKETQRQLAFLLTRIKQAAPQTLIVAA